MVVQTLLLLILQRQILNSVQTETFYPEIELGIRVVLKMKLRLFSTGVLKKRGICLLINLLTFKHGEKGGIFFPCIYSYHHLHHHFVIRIT